MKFILLTAVLELQASGPTPPEGYDALFNGKDLTGWKVEGEAAKHWVVKDGILDYDGKFKDLWTEKEYQDFTLQLEWRWTRPSVEVDRPGILEDGTEAKGEDGKTKMMKVPDAGDSGIYLRGSSKSQVNLWCWPVGSGEVYGYRTDGKMSPEVRRGVTPRKKADKPVGEWNHMVITMKGDRLTVVLNGEEVITGALLPEVAPKGPIAFQHHGDPLQFRKVFLKELPRP